MTVSVFARRMIFSLAGSICRKAGMGYIPSHKIRAIRDLLKTLREEKVIDAKTYRSLYRKSKGGFFRSRRHVKLYIEEHDLAKKK